MMVSRAAIQWILRCAGDASASGPDRFSVTMVELLPWRSDLIADVSGVYPAGSGDKRPGNARYYPSTGGGGSWSGILAHAGSLAVGSPSCAATMVAAWEASVVPWARASSPSVRLPPPR